MTEPQPKPFLPFYYGWVIVILSALALTFAWSIRVTFTVFYPAMIQELGWSNRDGTLGYSVSWLVQIIFSPVSGYMFDRFGPRITIPLGALMLVVGLGLLSTVESLWTYILYFGVIVGFGESLLLLSSAAVLPRWFVKRRGLVQGLEATGYAIGPIVFLPLMNHLIESAGWRDSFLVFALIVGGLIPIALLLCRGFPHEVGQFPDGTSSPAETVPSPPVSVPKADHPGQSLKDALGGVSFWAITVSFFFGVVSYNILLVHQLPRATDAGLDGSLSASIFGMAGFFTFIGVIAGGSLSDKIGREWVFTAGSVAAILGLSLFASLQGPEETWKIVVYAITAGLGFGFRLPLLTVIPADIFGGKSFGKILGSLQVGSALGGFTGPYVAGFLFDILESYLLAFALAAVAVGISGSLIWLAAPRRHRRLSHDKLLTV